MEPLPRMRKVQCPRCGQVTIVTALLSQETGTLEYLGTSGASNPVVIPERTTIPFVCPNPDCRLTGWVNVVSGTIWSDDYSIA